MSGQRSHFPLIPVIIVFCLLSSIWLSQTFPKVLGPWLNIAGHWLPIVLLILIVLLVISPPYVMRRLGNVAGYVKRAFERHHYQPVRNEYEFEQSYEQGYQAHTLPAVQESLAPYELPQAQYPQQQQPPM